MEELVHGLTGRMNSIEETTAKELALFVSDYNQTLNEISNQIEAANKRYDTTKIQQHIDTLSNLARYYAEDHRCQEPSSFRCLVEESDHWLNDQFFYYCRIAGNRITP